MMKLIKKQSLMARQTMGSFLVKIISLGLVLIAGIILARLLGPEGLGVYAFCLGIVAVLVIPASLGIQQLLIREIPISIARNYWGELKGLLLRGISSSLFVSMVLGCSVVLYAWLRGNSPTDRYALFWTAILLPCLAMLQIIGAFLRGFHVIVIGQFVELTAKPLIFLCMVFGIYIFNAQTLTPSQAISFQTIATLTACFLGILIAYKKGFLNFFKNVKSLHNKKFILSAITLMLYSGMSALNGNISILILGSWNMQKEVGWLSVAQRGTDVIPFALIAFGNSVGPKISSYYYQNKITELQHLINKSSFYILIYSVIVTILLITFANNIIEFVYGEKYLPAVIPFYIMSIAQLFNSLSGYCGLTLNMIGNEALTTGCMVVGFILNLVLNVLLIPKYGINGAAMASAAGLISWNFLATFILDKKFGIRSGLFLIRELVQKIPSI